MSVDFQCELKLKKLNPLYSRLVSNTSFVMARLLDKYTTHFPLYTDHSSIHSLQVIDFCNRLIDNQIDMLNEDELFTLLMACYLHDTGMGISDEDFKAFSDHVLSPEYAAEHPGEDVKDTIRKFHHVFSGEFIRKYAPLFEIPSDTHVEAIMKVARGHRKMDLFSEAEYPSDFRAPSGNPIRLVYLASLIRLADELDIAADRNIYFDFSEHEDDMEWRRHVSIKHMIMKPDRFILQCQTDEADVRASIDEAARKLQDTLDVCKHATEQRTDFKITQEKVVIEYI